LGEYAGAVTPAGPGAGQGGTNPPEAKAFLRKNLYFTRINTSGGKQTENNKLIYLTINTEKESIYTA